MTAHGFISRWPRLRLPPSQQPSLGEVLIESLQLNCKPIIASFNYPAELCDTEDVSAIRNGWREAASEILQRELGRAERSFLGLPVIESKLVDETPQITLMPLDEYRQLRGNQ